MGLQRSYALGVGVAAVQMGQSAGANASAVYATPAGKVDVGIDLTLCNKTMVGGVPGYDIAVDIYVVYANGQTCYKVAGMPVLAGATETWCDGNKIVLFPGDKLFVKSSVANSLDAELAFNQDTL